MYEVLWYDKVYFLCIDMSYCIAILEKSGRH